METKPKNQNAFPSGQYGGGMALRDYFASSAMQGIIASTEGIGLEINERHIEIVVNKAYMYADTMLKQRGK